MAVDVVASGKSSGQDSGKEGPDRGQQLAATHVVMGRIGAPYGIKGWVKLYSFADPAENLLEYQQFWITTDSSGSNESGLDASSLKAIEIDQARPQGGGFIGHIKGCDVREDTRHYTGKELLIPKDLLPALEEGWYWYELEGLRVVNQAGEDLGRIVRMLETGANDVMVVQGDAGSIDQEERLLPWVEGQVVTDVDLDARVVRVDWEKDW